MNWLLAVKYGIVDKKKLGLTSIPMIDQVGKLQLGGQKAHHDFLTELLNGIASGKSILSKGTARAAESLGPAARKFFNGIFPARGYMNHHIENVGSALHWAMDTRDPYSSCHDYSSAFGPYPKIASYFGLPGGDMAPGQKGGKKMVYDRTEYQTAWVQNHQSIKNSMPICEYASMPFTFLHPPAMDIRIFESSVLSAVTGIDYSVDRLWDTGDRIYTLRRAVAVMRENRTREQDDLSQVWFQRQVGVESLAAPLDRAKWEALKNRFYAVRGWNPANGRPTRPKLEQLGMKSVADKLQSAGRLG
jgi:aldehyde:ferredoxin oxidoreductase